MAGKKDVEPGKNATVPASEGLSGFELKAIGELALAVIKGGGPTLGSIEKSQKLLSDVLDRAAELVKPAEKK